MTTEKRQQWGEVGVVARHISHKGQKAISFCRSDVTADR